MTATVIWLYIAWLLRFSSSVYISLRVIFIKLNGFKDNSSTAEVENKRDCPNVETKSTDDRVIVEEKQNKISIDQDQDNSMKISPRLSEMDNTKSSESLDEQIEASKVEDDVIEADNLEIQDGTPRDIGPVAPMVCLEVQWVRSKVNLSSKSGRYTTKLDGRWL